MSGSRLAWVGSAVAPWVMALGLVVSITAQADQDRGGVESATFVEGSLTSTAFRPLGADRAVGPIAAARFVVGDREDLSALPDEVEPNPALKAAEIAMPAIDRSHKGDPVVALRPGIDARARRPSRAAVASTGSEADWPDDSRSPVAPASEPAPPPSIEFFSDGATPAIPLEIALISSSPSPSDGILWIGGARRDARATSAAPSDLQGKPNYAALIDPKDSARQMRCLAEAVYFEARSEPEAGQAAVAQVVLNRVRSGIFPTAVCGVVYQDRNRPFACQFSFACEGKSLRIEEPGAWTVATRIAQEVVSGVNFNPKVAEALNYHANYVMPFWAPSLRRVDRIGAHIFYAMRVGLNWAPGALNGRGDLPPVGATVTR
jgi:hypothetical protein